MSEPIIGLFKFGQREHLEQLADGLVYLNTLKYFAALEATNPRHDPWEGADHVWWANGGTLLMDGKPVAKINGHVRHALDRSRAHHVFCMYAVMESNAEGLFKAAELGFGDSWLCFIQADEFLRRVESAAIAAGLTYSTSRVEYIDETNFTGRMGAFRKRKQFEVESEARILVGPGGTEPLALQIGSIRDLVGPVNDVRDLAKHIKISRPG